MVDVKNVSVSGFLGTGSSAIIDLFKEFDNIGIALDKNSKGAIRPYEHKLLYTSSGLVETCTLLEHSNSAYSSDKIISNFYNKMMRLYKYDFGSFGNYKKLLDNDFLSIVDEFLKSINVVILKSGISRTEHKKKVRFSVIMVFLQFAAKIIYRKKIYAWGKKNILDHDKFYFSMPGKDIIHISAKNFTNSYFKLCHQKNKSVMIYDQLWNPSHLPIKDKFFDNNFYSIIVLRDPRDIFIYSKYIWSKLPYGFQAPLPTDVYEFIDFWKKSTMINVNDNRTKVIQFEDLVYNYEQTLQDIMHFLNIDEQTHLFKKKYFNPNLSIMNTQVFKFSDEYENEVKIIEENLSELLYKFPYDLQNSRKDIFENADESTQVK